MITHCKKCQAELTSFNRIEVHRKGKDGCAQTVAIRGLCRNCYLEQQREWQRINYNAKHPRGPQRSHKRKTEAPPEKVFEPGEPVKVIHPHFARWLSEQKAIVRQATNSPSAPLLHPIETA